MTVEIIPRAAHPISRQHIDPRVLKTLYRLRESGFQAYVVGGAVRDLLRGGAPKDFDVATDATPNEVRALFRHSRVIGRRFRLVHVVYGDYVVEVATLRQAASGPEPASAEEPAELYVEDDNCWGDVESDALRRDFTINALFYDIADFSLIDHVGGVADVQAGIIRSIGDPQIRFREDPVRMLRAIKFAARFGYTCEATTEAALRELPAEILKASRFRVIEEFYRILTQAHRHRGFELLRQYGLLQTLFPEWVAALGEPGLDQVGAFLERVDREAEVDRHVPLELLTAGLFLPLLGTVDPWSQAFHDRGDALDDEVRTLSASMDLPRKLVITATMLLRGQLYLLYFPHRPQQVQRFVIRPEFDWIWRLHDLAFGEEVRLHAIQEVWLHAREALPDQINGWSDRPDRRDIFSFRGQTGGGRHPAGRTDPITGRTEMRRSPTHRRGGRRRR